jgi:hypothetical protein
MGPTPCEWVLYDCCTLGVQQSLPRCKSHTYHFLRVSRHLLTHRYLIPTGNGPPPAQEFSVHAVVGLLGLRRVRGQPLRPVVQCARSDTTVALPAGFADRRSCGPLQLPGNPFPRRLVFRVQREYRGLDSPPLLPSLRRSRFQVPRSSRPVRRYNQLSG